LKKRAIEMKNLKTKKICKMILMLLIILSLTSCGAFDDLLTPGRIEFEYTGEYPELYSVAINSILGTLGHGGVPGPTDRALQPNIRILDEDDYGRVLFFYDEGVSRLSPYMKNLNLIIIQKAEGNYAYFYPYYNFNSSSYENNRWEFTDEDIETLKEGNSWNQKLSEDSEFVRVRIARRKEDGPVSFEQLVQLYRLVFPDIVSGPSVRNMDERMVFLRMDNYGRSIFLSVGAGDNQGKYFAILLQPDHSLDLETGVLEIVNHTSYQTELRLFKEANGWGTLNVID
jgi:hypothetical protein